MRTLQRLHNNKLSVETKSYVQINNRETGSGRKLKILRDGED